MKYLFTLFHYNLVFKRGFIKRILRVGYFIAVNAYAALNYKSSALALRSGKTRLYHHIKHAYFSVLKIIVGKLC